MSQEFSKTVLITGENVDRYADASGDHNPIHLDQAAALAAGLPGRISHGMLVMGLMVSTAVEWMGADRPVVRTSCRFAGMVPVGDSVTFTGTVTDLGEGRQRMSVAAVRSSDGIPVLRNAEVDVGPASE